MAGEVRPEILQVGHPVSFEGQPRLSMWSADEAGVIRVDGLAVDLRALYPNIEVTEWVDVPMSGLQIRGSELPGEWVVRPRPPLEDVTPEPAAEAQQSVLDRDDAHAIEEMHPVFALVDGIVPTLPDRYDADGDAKFLNVTRGMIAVGVTVDALNRSHPVVLVLSPRMAALLQVGIETSSDANGLTAEFEAALAESRVLYRQALMELAPEKPRCETISTLGRRCTLAAGHPTGPFTRVASQVTNGLIDADGHVWEEQADG